MANPARERGDSIDAGRLMEVYETGKLTEEQFKIIDPYLDEIKEKLHEEWEKLGTTEGQNAKTLHFHVKTINEIKRLMKHRVTKGRNAEKRLGEANG